uniref:Reverse transcriptase domain-containing protein n=1 Tax=Panagrolaimus sp. ES5 TaxID=591445 RepID=A0AC34FUL3_9BILA
MIEDFSAHNNDVYLCNITFNYAVVKKFLRVCVNKNLSGPDGIPGVLIKECADVLAYPFSILFNHMMKNCDVPDVFLISHVSPIPKIANPTLLSHFRPIAGTSDIYKTAERVIKEQLIQHLNCTKFLPDEQYGFRTGCSTTKQMIIFMEDVTKATSEGKTTDVLYIDMEKAFDKMPISEIVDELIEAKIGGNLLKLIIYLLSNRKFLVKVNGHYSKYADSNSGVSQGGVLSAVLFIIFFSKLSKLLNENDLLKLVKHLKFADDLKLYFSYFAEKFDPRPLQKALDTVSQWCTLKSMSINASKTVHVQFGPKNPNAKYLINNTQITQKEVTRDLGLYIRDDLTLDFHFDKISAAAAGKMFSIFRKIITNEPKILIQIFTTYIRPNYEYASSIFNVSAINAIKTLEAVQKLFTKIVYQRNNPNVKYWEIPPYSERLKLYGMMSLHHGRIIADIMRYDDHSPKQ